MTTPPADSDLPGFSLMSLQIKRFRSGFTLVEVVIAIGVFSVVVLSVGALFLHALRINAETEESMRAMDILRCESESLRARPWDKLPSRPDISKPTAYMTFISPKRRIPPGTCVRPLMSGLIRNFRTSTPHGQS